MFFNVVWFCCRIISLYLRELGQILVKRHLKTSFLNMRLTSIIIYNSLVLKFGSVGQRQCCSKYCFLLCSVMKGFWQYFQTAILTFRMGRKRGRTEFQQSLSSRALLSRYNNYCCHSFLDPLLVSETNILVRISAFLKGNKNLSYTNLLFLPG